MDFGSIFILILYTMDFASFSSKYYTLWILPHFHPKTIDYEFWPNYHRNTIDCRFWPKFHPNAIHYGFWPNFHPNTIDWLLA